MNVISPNLECVQRMSWWLTVTSCFKFGPLHLKILTIESLWCHYDTSVDDVHHISWESGERLLRNLFYFHSRLFENCGNIWWRKCTGIGTLDSGAFKESVSNILLQPLQLLRYEPNVPIKAPTWANLFQICYIDSMCHNEWAMSFMKIGHLHWQYCLLKFQEQINCHWRKCDNIRPSVPDF